MCKGCKRNTEIAALNQPDTNYPIHSPVTVIHSFGGCETLVPLLLIRFYEHDFDVSFDL